MVRIFVALELPEKLRCEIAETGTRLAVTNGRLSFVRPELMHITLKFVGEVSDEECAVICEALSRIPPCSWTMRPGAISVNSRKHLRTVWVPVADDGEGAALAQVIDDALGACGIAREKRRFRAHITVARVRQDDEDLLPLIDGLTGCSFEPFAVSGFVLKKSTLTPHGPVYENLLEVRDEPVSL